MEYGFRVGRMESRRSAPRILAGIFSLSSLVVASACVSNTDTDATADTPTTVTTTATAEGDDAAQGTDNPSPPESHTDTASPTSGSAPGEFEGAQFTRIPQDTYDIGLADTETAVFTSGDGTIHCSFTAEQGQYSFPQQMFAIDETTGNCVHGMEGSGGEAENIKITTNAELQDGLAQPQADGPPSTMPEAPATLDSGEFVHLGKMGCFAPDPSEITCTKFTTGDAFTINDSGFQQVSAEEVQEQLRDDAGYTQVLSRVIDLPLNGTDGIRCFYDSTYDSRYSCMSLSPSGWEATEGAGPANLLSWRVEDGTAEFERAFGANPGFDIYESRQPLEPGKYRLDAGMVADYDGSQVTFTTTQGDSFWVDGPDYGTATSG